MTSQKHRPIFKKSTAQEIIEYILLILCMVVIALRITFTEAPGPQSSIQPYILWDDVFTLAVSTVLILCFIFWLLYSLFSSGFTYRLSAIELGLALFCLAALISGLAAANKRDAVTDFVSLVAPVIMALLLVQILDSDRKIRLLLISIVALAVLTTYQCIYQLIVENRTWIDFYNEDPQQMLENLGIQPGSFHQMLFEHRLYSKDVKGFFTTSNSAGSFLILAVFAALSLFISRLKNHAEKKWKKPPVLTGIIFTVVLLGLFITRSKGAVAAFIIAAAMFAVYFLASGWLRAHKKLLLTVVLFLAVVTASLVVTYGNRHGRLPGGNSMLVRWQYWNSAARMYTDHPLTGVGPGNFGKYYTHYKPDAALESVGDPHNFLLTILTQYGPIGLFAFLAMIFYRWPWLSFHPFRHPCPSHALPKVT
ncbi:MAG: O-antigen ligase family protein [Planctomycetota bacterium]|jgi:O-antigen ligase